MMTTTGRLAFSFEEETVGRLAFSFEEETVVIVCDRL